MRGRGLSLSRVDQLKEKPAPCTHPPGSSTRQRCQLMLSELVRLLSESGARPGQQPAEHASHRVRPKPEEASPSARCQCPLPAPCACPCPDGCRLTAENRPAPKVDR